MRNPMPSLDEGPDSGPEWQRRWVAGAALGQQTCRSGSTTLKEHTMRRHGEVHFSKLILKHGYINKDYNMAMDNALVELGPGLWRADRVYGGTRDCGMQGLCMCPASLEV